MIGKQTDIETAMAHVTSGSRVMMGEFVGAGEPLTCVEWLSRQPVSDLTLITNTAGLPGGFGKAALFRNGQVSRLIGSHVGTTAESTERYLGDDLLVQEFFPMGTWAEKVRAGAVGLGGVLVPVGVGILDQPGLFEKLEAPKQTLELNGQTYLVEEALEADVSIIKGFRADPMGNIEFRNTSMQNQKDLAMAGRYTIAEVNEVVGLGDIPPDRVGCPGVFVDAVVLGKPLQAQHGHYRDHWIGMGRLAPMEENVKEPAQ